MPTSTPTKIIKTLLILSLTTPTFSQHSFPITSTSSTFLYDTFNSSQGLTLNGDAATTSCELDIDLTSLAGFPDLMDNADEFGEVHKANDVFEDTTYETIGEKSSEQTTTFINTADARDEDIRNIEKFSSSFGHRDSFKHSKEERCSTRIRLTSSSPDKAGSVFRSTSTPVAQGFDTLFTFQISDHSQVCTEHIDSSFGLKLHKTCVVHGGDGLAFVLQGSGPTSLGTPGKGLGYEGIKNALAIEFDTWTNVDSPDLKTNDIFRDHVSIHADVTSEGVMSSEESSSLISSAKAYELADGAVHLVRIRYFPSLQTKYFLTMTANANLLPFLKDNAESRRLGTLAVFIDEGVHNDEPILAIPINLSVLLNLEQNSLAYAGFTASTGKSWEKHDVLSWVWCDEGNCDKPSVNMDKFDYGQESKFFTARHNVNSPGDLYGRDSNPVDGGGEKMPLQEEWKNIEPWTVTPSRTASGFSNRLSDDAGNAVRPSTEF